MRRVAMGLLMLLLVATVPPTAAADGPTEGGWALVAAGFGNDVVHDVTNAGGTLVAVGSFSGWLGLSENVQAIDANASSVNLDGFIAWAAPNGTWMHGSLINSDNGSESIDRVAALDGGDVLVAGRYCSGTAGEACSASYGDDGILEKEYITDDGGAFLARISPDATWMWATSITSEDAVLVLDLIAHEDEAVLAIHHQNNLRLSQWNGTGEDHRLGATALRFDASGTLLGQIQVSSGTTNLEEEGALCVDRLGTVHLVLNYASNLIADDRLIESPNGIDVAVLRIVEDATEWMVSTSSNEDVTAVACTAAAQDGIVLTGTMRGEVAFGDRLNGSASSIDVWTARLTEAGEWQDLEVLGGTGTDRPSDVMVNAEGSRLLVGSSTAAMRLDDVVLTDGDGVDRYDAADGWLVHLGLSEDARWARALAGPGDERITALTIDGQGRWVIVGTFDGDLDLENNTLDHQGGTDVFLWAYAADLDDDGVLDGIDVCPRVANTDQADLDGDGNGDACDEDDDNDGLADELDDCPRGRFGWRSTSSTDHDGDGCRDIDEDFDDDEDGIFDHLDACPKGPIGWVSSPEGDEDQDGCSDIDTDGDGWVDQADVCPTVSDPNQLDMDGDGVGNACDDDVDGDGISEEFDACPVDFFSWTSTPATDHDGDGCKDAEELDDDNDGVLDAYDRCPTGDVGWSVEEDHDGDGCRDEEDLDDDDDGRLDPADGCPRGTVGRLGLALDADGDGCSDLEEDDDDDQDGVVDDLDRCARTEAGSVVDGRGCSAAQADDDDDGIPNLIDLCVGTEEGLRVDLDGCPLAGQSASNSGMAPLQWIGLVLMVLAAVGFVAALVIVTRQQGEGPQPAKQHANVEEE